MNTRQENSRAWRQYRKSNPQSTNDNMARRLIEMERNQAGSLDANQRIFVGQMLSALTSEEREEANRLGIEAC